MNQRFLGYLIVLICSLYAGNKAFAGEIQLHYGKDPGIEKANKWLKAYRPELPLIKGGTLMSSCELSEGSKDLCFIDLGSNKNNYPIVLSTKQKKQDPPLTMPTGDTITNEYSSIYPIAKTKSVCADAVGELGNACLGIVSRGGFGLKSVQCSRYNMNPIKLGDFEFSTDGLGKKLEGHACTEGEKLNLIGLPVFENSIWKFSFYNNKGNITKLSTLSAKKNDIHLPLNRKSGEKIKFKGYLGAGNKAVSDKPIGIIFDTGARGTLVDKQLIVEIINEYESMGLAQPLEFMRSFEALDTTGTPFYPDLYRLNIPILVRGSNGSEISLGAGYVMVADFRSLIRGALGEGYSVILGMNHIRAADWTLDLSQNELLVSPNNESKLK